ncbi:ATP-dependent DNA helicase [Sphingomonas astaxanthinifaciens]|uniref:DNA helicase n=1 Tax=Sphingomonas astaxanthinifaciens DSM 22298 TaxID=1123267 RepID=A0ABQ5Z9D4_9SPHN|nr:ATP-dependent DNA helicase [Sphingomonas astaxanthinifaciens]GLR48222.1 DNA helicase [Sphingomonas astaxanthinifaciens DSM 22298]
MASSFILPALHASHAGIWLVGPNGVRPVGRGEAIRAVSDTPHVILNAPLTGQRLGYPEVNALDLLELFAFVHPARFVVPTVAGLAGWCGIEAPADEAGQAALLPDIANRLLAVLDGDWAEREGAWTSSMTLQRLGWGWAGLVGQRLAKPERGERMLFSRLEQWEEAAERPPARMIRLGDGEAEARLRQLTGAGAESRDGQRAFAAAAAHAFAPRDRRDSPNLLLAEAGTGIGKTLGYLAPASLWAEKAGGTVWVSTYTKALQRQLDAEGQRIIPDPVERKKRIVIRKGRENYLCLLNLEDALQGAFSGRAAVLAQLVGRWAAYSKDGDMVGGDLPGWLPSLFRRAGATALTDRRGECVYAGCPHYRKCFIEKAERASRGADLVIANHALVMVSAARGRLGGGLERIVFDEGHHLFDAADSTFSVALTGAETIELRRWIMGPERSSRGRRRGLAARLMDVCSYDDEGAVALDAAVQAAQLLPGDGWLGRVVEGAPFGPLESLFAAVRGTVLARARAEDAGYGIETELAEPDGPLVEAAAAALEALETLQRPLSALRMRLEAVLEDSPDWLDGAARARVEGAISGLTWRGQALAAWVQLLARVGGIPDPDFVDWLAVDRVEGRELDIGLQRRWLDPTRPLAKAVLEPAQGVLVTSATLRGGEEGWGVAEARTGATHLAAPAEHFHAASPFDYAASAEVLVVTDVKQGDLAALANAYARLIAAAEGGTLGLFTAIQRLKAVQARIADRLARDRLPLLAQHVDPIDTGTLVDMFRADPRASLLGTDALRDGVDVPGESLRLVVMERVPWPRPTVLHAARRLAGGGSAYDDRVVKARLAQAFGRLIRRQGDRGTFVILSAACPSRLLTAFPEGVKVSRVPLDEAVARVASARVAKPDSIRVSEVAGRR